MARLHNYAVVKMNAPVEWYAALVAKSDQVVEGRKQFVLDAAACATSFMHHSARRVHRKVRPRQACMKQGTTTAITANSNISTAKFRSFKITGHSSHAQPFASSTVSVRSAKHVPPPPPLPLRMRSLRTCRIKASRWVYRQDVLKNNVLTQRVIQPSCIEAGALESWCMSVLSRVICNVQASRPR